MMGVLRLAAFDAGSTDDSGEALGWFDWVAAQAEPLAIMYLGALQVDGGRLGRRDIGRAAEVFRRCSETCGNGRCLCAYATALDLGLETARDPVKACAMYGLAFGSANLPGAKAKRDELKRALSPAQTARAHDTATANGARALEGACSRGADLSLAGSASATARRPPHDRSL